jgi:hypothetical protein
MSEPRLLTSATPSLATELRHDVHGALHGGLYVQSARMAVTCRDRSLTPVSFSFLSPVNTVSRAYIARLSKERGQLSAAGGGIMSPGGSL